MRKATVRRTTEHKKASPFSSIEEECAKEAEERTGLVPLASRASAAATSYVVLLVVKKQENR